VNTAIINERKPKHDIFWRRYIFVSRNKEVFINLTNELLIFLDLEEYDQIELTDNEDGTLTVRKEKE
jgi:translation elongation factor P/translation initiation factor 5A